MNKVIYTLFIAFVSSLLTVVTINFFTNDQSNSKPEQLKLISKQELEKHNTVDSCWKAINGRVYDITTYIPMHPTPPHVIASWCGKEASVPWSKIKNGDGHSDSAAKLLEPYFVGILQEGE